MYVRFYTQRNSNHKLQVAKPHCDVNLIGSTKILVLTQVAVHTVARPPIFIGGRPRETSVYVYEMLMSCCQPLILFDV